MSRTRNLRKALRDLRRIPDIETKHGGLRTAVHKFCSMLPAFVFEARPVIPIDDAVRVELESIAFRDGLKRK